MRLSTGYINYCAAEAFGFSCSDSDIGLQRDGYSLEQAAGYDAVEAPHEGLNDHSVWC